MHVILSSNHFFASKRSKCDLHQMHEKSEKKSYIQHADSKKKR